MLVKHYNIELIMYLARNTFNIFPTFDNSKGFDVHFQMCQIIENIASYDYIMLST